MILWLVISHFIHFKYQIFKTIKIINCRLLFIHNNYLNSLSLLLHKTLIFIPVIALIIDHIIDHIIAFIIDHIIVSIIQIYVLILGDIKSQFRKIFMQLYVNHKRRLDSFTKWNLFKFQINYQTHLSYFQFLLIFNAVFLYFYDHLYQKSLIIYTIRFLQMNPIK